MLIISQSALCSLRESLSSGVAQRAEWQYCSAEQRKGAVQAFLCCSVFFASIHKAVSVRQQHRAVLYEEVVC